MAKWPSDKELEEIYRKGSEQHDFQYDPRAWDQMKKLLDQQKRRRYGILLLFALLFISISGIVYYKLSDSGQLPANQKLVQTHDGNPGLIDSEKTKQDQTTVHSADEPLVGKDVRDPSLINSKESSQRDLTEHEQSGDQISNAKSVLGVAKPDGTTEQNVQPGQSLARGKVQPSNQSSISTSERDDPLNPDKPDVRATVAAKQQTGRNNAASTPEIQTVSEVDQNPDTDKVSKTVDANPSITNTDQISTDQISISNQSDQASQQLSINQIKNDKSGMVRNIVMIDQVASKGIQPFPTEINNNFIVPQTIDLTEVEEQDRDFKFSVGAQFGLESSWTPNGEYSRIDYSAGLGFSYLFNKKLGLSLGANYIKDSYTAMAEDYKPPSGYWKSKGVPDWTSATCEMLEMSYGISYFFNGIDQKGFATSINVLSNFMLSEMYYYHYPDESNNFVNSWNMDNKTLFSALAIDASYNIPVGNRWALRAGPFIKIPIDGIGHGSVMLSSIGIRIQTSILSK